MEECDGREGNDKEGDREEEVEEGRDCEGERMLPGGRIMFLSERLRSVWERWWIAEEEEEEEVSLKAFNDVLNVVFDVVFEIPFLSMEEDERDVLLSNIGVEEGTSGQVRGTLGRTVTVMAEGIVVIDVSVVPKGERFVESSSSSFFRKSVACPFVIDVFTDLGEGEEEGEAEGEEEKNAEESSRHKER